MKLAKAELNTHSKRSLSVESLLNRIPKLSAGAAAAIQPRKDTNGFPRLLFVHLYCLLLDRIEKC